MDQRISVITVGVSDLERSRTFYEALGWRATSRPGGDDIVFFQSGGIVFALWDRTSLATDSAVTDSGGWGGVTLAHNTRTAEEVDHILTVAVGAGATLGRAAAETFWGGYSGVFIDPDGHPWEVAHNPFWAIADDGSIDLGQ